MKQHDTKKSDMDVSQSKHEMSLGKRLVLTASLALILPLAGCSAVVVDGKMIPSGSPEASYQYAGHSFDIVPVLGRKDRIVLRGTKFSADTQLTNVSIVSENVYPTESIVVIKGTKYSGDYLPTWEIVSTASNSINIHRIPSGGGNPPYTFAFNPDGLEIYSSDGPGMFYRQNKFYSLASYQHAKNSQRQRVISGQSGKSQRTAYRHAEAPQHNTQERFVDDVGRVEGRGLNSSDTISHNHIDLQD